MAGITSFEARLKRLEELFKAVKQLVADMGHRVGQVAEDSSRDARPLQRGAGNARYAVVTTEITIRVGDTLGMGAGTLQATTYDDTTGAGTNADSGDPVPLYSGDAVSTVAVDRLVIVANVGGRYSVITDYCPP